MNHLFIAGLNVMTREISGDFPMTADLIRRGNVGHKCLYELLIISSHCIIKFICQINLWVFVVIMSYFYETTYRIHYLAVRKVKKTFWLTAVQNLARQGRKPYDARDQRETPKEIVLFRT